MKESNFFNSKLGKNGISEHVNTIDSSDRNHLLINNTDLSKSFNEPSIHLNQQLLIDDEHNKQVPSSSSSTTMSLGKRFIANSFIANLIPSSAFQPLKMPFPEDEHFLLSSESSYYVNDKNLSSIVAFSLSSKDYKEFQINSKLNNKELSTKTNDLEPENSLNKFHFEHRKPYIIINWEYFFF